MVPSELALTSAETSKLSEYEETIERHIEAFWEVGNALMAIRDQKLYREDYKTFEQYCKERWAIERREAYKLIDSARVVQNVPILAQIGSKQSHTAPLSPLPPDQQREAYQKAKDTAPNGKVTAKHVQAVVEGMNPPAHPVLHYPVSDALAYATMAITQLEKIRPDDPTKAEALDEVIQWIKTHR